MVLIITITLSNGSVVKFELSNSIYTLRSLIRDENDTLYSELHIIRDKDNVSYVFDSRFQGFTECAKSELDNGINIDLVFEDFSEEYQFNDYKGFKLERAILENTKIVTHYIQFNQLNCLTKESDFLNNVAIIKDNFLFIFADLETIDFEGVKIIDIKTEWTNQFTNDVLRNIHLIEQNE